jgi:YaaC-like Protein
MKMADDPFKRLRRFESSDLVHEYYVKLHEREPSATLKQSIVASFRQGRQLIESAANTEVLARPITQFYGVSALCRGLALTAKSGGSESALTAGHGLNASNLQAGLSDLVLKTTSGLFSDLQDAVGRAVYRTNSDSPEWSMHVGAIAKGVSFRLVDAWTGRKAVPRVELQTVTSSIENGRSVWTFQGQVDEDELKAMFGQADATVSGMVVECDVEFRPQLAQAYVFGTIGSVLLRTSLGESIRLSDIGTYYSVSYALSMMARYRPSAWMAVWSGRGSDRVLPFVDSYLTATTERFPALVGDHLEFIGR